MLVFKSVDVDPEIACRSRVVSDQYKTFRPQRRVDLRRIGCEETSRRRREYAGDINLSSRGPLSVNAPVDGRAP